ncbi:MAG: PfkB family carbohydrate kinase [Negativicutes bacterium]|nr:PfkB family carbohydrate kinase [Negativicutes bacterium]
MKYDEREAERIIERFSSVSLLVVGDQIADVYVDGRIARVSREAPVLVLEYEREKLFPGGAANVVQSILSLGGNAKVVGLVGEDSYGSELRDRLQQLGADTSGLLTVSDRPTVSKTRITAGGQATVRQQVVRIDREDRTPLPAMWQKEVNDAAVRAVNAGVNGVILSDYGCGLLTGAVGQGIIGLSRLRRVPCMVDSRYSIASFLGADFVKQNEDETAKALGLDRLTPGAESGDGLRLIRQIKAGMMLLTRGPDGGDLIGGEGEIHHIPAHNVSEVYDVTGAGDTMVAAFMLSVASGAEPLAAAVIANAAAGVVVRKWGAATVTAAELRAALVAGRVTG